MVTVFLATFNRLDTLRRTVDSFDALDTPLQLVIVDLCNTSFLLSWCLQYGFGVPADDEASRQRLFEAIPVGSVWRDHAHDWLRMLYANDFSGLGWEEYE